MIICDTNQQIYFNFQKNTNFNNHSALNNKMNKMENGILIYIVLYGYYLYKYLYL